MLDQTVFGGAGNIFKNEVLFRLKKLPTTPIKKFSLKKLIELVNTMKIFAGQFYTWRKAFVLREHYQIYRHRLPASGDHGFQCPRQPRRRAGRDPVQHLRRRRPDHRADLGVADHHPSGCPRRLHAAGRQRQHAGGGEQRDSAHRAERASAIAGVNGLTITPARAARSRAWSSTVLPPTASGSAAAARRGTPSSATTSAPTPPAPPIWATRGTASR